MLQHAWSCAFASFHSAAKRFLLSLLERFVHFVASVVFALLAEVSLAEVALATYRGVCSSGADTSSSDAALRLWGVMRLF